MPLNKETNQPINKYKSFTMPFLKCFNLINEETYFGPFSLQRKMYLPRLLYSLHAWIHEILTIYNIFVKFCIHFSPRSRCLDTCRFYRSHTHIPMSRSYTREVILICSCLERLLDSSLRAARLEIFAPMKVLNFSATQLKYFSDVPNFYEIM